MSNDYMYSYDASFMRVIILTYIIYDLPLHWNEGFVWREEMSEDIFAQFFY